MTVGDQYLLMTALFGIPLLACIVWVEYHIRKRKKNKH